MLVSHMKRFIYFFCLQRILLNFMHENISSPDNMISFGFIYEKKKILNTIISQKQKFIGFHGWKSNAIIKKIILKNNSFSFIHKKNCLKKQINLFQALKHFFVLITFQSVSHMKKKILKNYLSSFVSFFTKKFVQPNDFLS